MSIRCTFSIFSITFSSIDENEYFPYLPWTQDLNWTYIRRSEDGLDVFWTSYTHSVHVMCLRGLMSDLVHASFSFYHYRMCKKMDIFLSYFVLVGILLLNIEAQIRPCQIAMMKLFTNTAQKWRFPLRISSVKVTKSAISCGFCYIYWRNS